MYIVPSHLIDEPLNTLLTGWYERCVTKCHDHIQVASALLIQGHWIPVIFRQAVNAQLILTTTCGADWIDAATQHLHTMPRVDTTDLPCTFLNDCGFQSVAWLTAKLTYADNMVPFTVDNAVTWRGFFEHHLQSTGFATVLVRPDLLPCGAANTPDLLQQLQQLLEAHGVPAAHSKARADIVLERLGRMQITNVLRSAQPWKDLKSLANQCAPKLQLVLAAELQAVINRRLEDPTPFGNRKKKAPRQDNVKVQLQPEDIQVPEGIFKAGESTPLAQIGLLLPLQHRPFHISKPTDLSPVLALHS